MVASLEPGPDLTPGSFTFKLIFFLAGLLLLVFLLMLVARWWGRFYREKEFGQNGLVRRVLKNSLTPIVATVVNKVIDFGFAAVMLRYLGVIGNGRYEIATVVLLYLSTTTDFGLGVLTTREVARDCDQANHYLSNTVLLRWIFAALSLPLVFVIIRVFGLTAQPLHPQSQAALWLFSASLFPAGLSEGITSLFRARERMEVPAFAALLTNVLKVFSGVGALAAGWGVVGLAASALLVTTINALLFVYLQFRLLFHPRFELSLSLWRWMLPEALPLFLNNLLLLVWFRFDTFVLQAYQGEEAVGAYGAAYKFINATSFVLFYFTLAFFPLFSRYAVENRGRLERTYHTALKVLLLLAFPGAMATSILSEKLIYFLGGREFLPDSAIALSILIWFLPLSYVNGVTQYALIAVDRQRTITFSFLITALFNVVANILFIPRHGYVAASVITILSEGVLFIPFAVVVWREIGRLPLPQLTWRPALASAVMGGLMVWLYQQGLWVLALLGGVPLYLGVLLLLRTFTAEERALLRRLWPGRRVEH